MWYLYGPFDYSVVFHSFVLLWMEHLFSFFCCWKINLNKRQKYIEQHFYPRWQFLVLKHESWNILNNLHTFRIWIHSKPIRVDMFVHQTWKESRLKLPNDIFEEGDDYVTLPPEFFDNLWQPDPYFLNSKIAGKLLSTYFWRAWTRY